MTQLGRLRTLVPICLMTCTGCASLFGPYVAVDSATSAGTKSVVTTSEAQTLQTAQQSTRPTDKPKDADSTDSSVRSQFDTTSVIKTVTTEDSRNATPAASDAIIADSTAEPSSVKNNASVQKTPQQSPSLNADQSDTQKENPFAEMDRQGLLQTSATSSATGTASHAASVFHEAEPRLPSAACPAPEQCCVGVSPVTQAYPDEYICDGGDRALPVHYAGTEMQGLDTEDTIAEYKDQDGKNHVQPSNRVCVYAPRFGAVRTVSGPDIDVKVDRAAGATDVAGAGSLHDKRGFEAGIHRSVASGVAAKRSAGGVETSQPAHLSEKAESAILSAKVDQGLESKVSQGLNLLRTSDVHELNLQILEANTSSINTASNVSQALSQATQTYSTFRVQAMTGSEKGGRPGKIHITKTASPLVAKAGDTITFTIQFRNVGDYNVGEVRIIDNLTPRLTYIQGTGQIDVGDGAGGGLTVAPNKEGSQTLIFELDEPLQGGKSGRITFQAKVL